MRITKKAVDKITPPTDSDQALYWDDKTKGFGLRITAAGVKSYIVKGRVKGKGTQRRITIGRHGQFTPDQAREEAEKILADLRKGIDPTLEEKKDSILDKTLRQYADDYIDPANRTPDKRLKQTTIDNINLHTRVTFSDWTDKPLAAITREQIREHFLKLSARTPAQANQAYRVLRSIWNFARDMSQQSDGTYLLAENPVSSVLKSKTHGWNTVQPKNRKIPTDWTNGKDRVGTVWNLLMDMRQEPAQTTVGRACTDLVCFLLLTGARFNEGAALQWDHVDLKGRSWTLDADQAKNKQGVTFPLSSLAVRILKERPRTDSPYVFPGRNGTGHVSDVRGIMAKVNEAAGTDKLSAHDLRRTFRSIAGEAGIDFLTTKLLMNHIINNDVTAKHYTESHDLTYLQSAVERIGAWVEQRAKVAAAENVIPFPRQKAVGE